MNHQRGDACLLLPKAPRRVLKSRAGSGGVLVQSGEFCTEGSDQPFILGVGKFDRLAIGDGDYIVPSGDPGAG